MYRFARYNYCDITDYKIFPNNKIDTQASPFHFTDVSNNFQLGDSLLVNNAKGDACSLDELMYNTQTVAFIIIRNDTILYEKYFEDYAETSIVASFSMAKSFVSALTGIAIAENYIKDENEPVTNYVPELKTSGFDKVTIKHLLQMTSGIKYSERYNDPFSDVAKHYYGTGMREKLLKLKLDKVPGTQFFYKSIDTQLLGLVIERATGRSLSSYIEEKIWKPLGMEYVATWSLDQIENGIEKAYCCLNARAIDFAKFGKLYLNGGSWNNIQIVPEEWVKKSVAIDTLEASPWYYQYQWWLASRIYGDYWAEGHHGQYIYVYPPKKLVIVRLGKRPGNVYWGSIFRQITKLL